MNKQELLEHVKTLAAAGQLTDSELLQAYRSGGGQPQYKSNRFQLDLAKILYGIGGIIVIAGLIFLIVQMWDSFGAAAQIAVTLGSAIALYIAGVFLTQTPEHSKILSSILFLISAVIMPIGIFVTLHHLSPGGNVWLGQLIIAGLPAAVYFLSHLLFKNPLNLFISILFSTWTLTALLGYMLDHAGITENPEEIWNYWALAAGISYILLGYSFSESRKRQLTSALYFLGSAAALGAGYGLTFAQDFWIIIYFLLILTAIYLSTVLRSRSFLLFGSIALIFHLTHISFEYFANSLGFPLALIISGFIIIGIGYTGVLINKRYISKTAIDSQ